MNQMTTFWENTLLEEEKAQQALVQAVFSSTFVEWSNGKFKFGTFDRWDTICGNTEYALASEVFCMGVAATIKHVAEVKAKLIKPESEIIEQQRKTIAELARLLREEHRRNINLHFTDNSHWESVLRAVGELDGTSPAHKLG